MMMTQSMIMMMKTHMMLSMPCLRSLSRSSSLDVERPRVGGELKYVSLVKTFNME